MRHMEKHRQGGAAAEGAGEGLGKHHHRGGSQLWGEAPSRLRDGSPPRLDAVGAPASGQAIVGTVCRELKTIQTDQNRSASHYSRALDILAVSGSARRTLATALTNAFPSTPFFFFFKVFKEQNIFLFIYFLFVGHIAQHVGS